MKSKKHIYCHKVHGHQTWQGGNMQWVAHSLSYMILQLHGFVRSCDKLNTLYLHLHWTNDHRTKQGDNLLWGASILNSLNTLNMCSCEATWQIINIIAPLSQCLWSLELTGWWHTRRSSYPKIHTFQCWLVRSREKLIHISTSKGPICTKLSKVLTREVPNIVTWLFNHVTNASSRDNLKNLNLRLHKTYDH